jgi:hypothetical protein
MAKKIQELQIRDRWFYRIGFTELANLHQGVVTYTLAANDLTPEQRAELDRLIEERKPGKGR